LRNYYFFLKGNIIGGIIGTDIVRYDVYGKDVMIANKMESNGEPAKINVSESVKNAIDRQSLDKFYFEKNKTVTLPSFDNEKVDCYFLYKKFTWNLG
jgi:hypothetical protein